MKNALDTRSAESPALSAELSSATDVMSLTDTTRLLTDKGLIAEELEPETTVDFRMAG